MDYELDKKHTIGMQASIGGGRTTMSARQQTRNMAPSGLDGSIPSTNPVIRQRTHTN